MSTNKIEIPEDALPFLRVGDSKGDSEFNTRRLLGLENDSVSLLGGSLIVAGDPRVQLNVGLFDHLQDNAVEAPGDIRTINPIGTSWKEGVPGIEGVRLHVAILLSDALRMMGHDPAKKDDRLSSVDVSNGKFNDISDGHLRVSFSDNVTEIVHSPEYTQKIRDALMIARGHVVRFEGAEREGSGDPRMLWQNPNRNWDGTLRRSA